MTGVTHAAEAPTRVPLDRLLTPRSIAIVGASDKPGALGASVLANLDRAGFAGPIHLVNPKRETIGQRRCFATIDDLPEGIDVAVLAIPRAAVLDVMAALARRRVGAAVLFAAGFAEDGPPGIADQQEIARIAHDAGMIVEGPNCLGLFNFRDNIPLTFIEMPEAKATGERRVGIISQSGAMAAVLATTLIARDVPLASYVSTGNEAVCGVEDFIDHAVDDAGVAVIGMIVEQFRKPQRFLQAARAAVAQGKRIVLLHPGSSEAGRKSAATHTGALAGDYQVMRVLAEHAGVIFAETLEELGDMVEIALRCPRLPGRGTAIVAESGAFKALMLDQCEREELYLPALTDADSPALRAALPPFVPVTNPLDVTAQGLVDPGLYGRTLGALAEDDRIDTILLTLINTMAASSHVKFNAVADALRTIGRDKAIVVAGVDEGGGIEAADVDALRALGIPYLPTAERGLRAIARLAASAATDEPAQSTPTDSSHRFAAEIAPGTMIPEYRAKHLLAPFGLSFPDAALARAVEEATAIAAAIGYPVVLKAQAAALPHKTDAGGVVVGLADEAALVAGWAKLTADVAAARPDLALDGVLVEKMGAKGIELIVGARRDPEWGPVVLVGFGGVAAELTRDVRLLPPELPAAAIVAELRKLRMAALFDGYRGAPAVDLEAVAELVALVGAVIVSNPGLQELDLNPVIAYPAGAGVVALDALMTF